MINSLGNSISRNGLVGEWLLDGNRLDTSGNGYNGTARYLTYTKTTKGYQRQACRFNSGKSYINLGNILNNNTTISFWIQTTSSMAGGIITKNNRAEYGIDIKLTSGFIRFGNWSSTYGRGYLNSSSKINDGKWHHIVCSLIKNKSIYIDGKLSSTGGNILISFDTSNMFIGVNLINNIYLNGNIQSVRFYNRPLSKDEIQLLYLEGLRKLGPTSVASYPKLLDGLVGYFENPTGTELWEIANGVKATYVGGTNTTDNLGINKAIINPNYTWSSIVYTTGYTFENSGSGWNIVTSPDGLSETGINRATTLRNIFLFNRELSADEISTLQALCNSDYIYPAPSYSLLNLQDGLLLNLNGTNNGTTTLYDISGNGINGTVSSTPTYKRQGKVKTISLSSQSISWTSTSFTTSTCFEKVSGKWTLVVNPSYITTTGVTSGTIEITDIRLYNRTLSTKEQEQLKYSKLGNFIY